MRILFLGNNYNPISITCLTKLINSGKYNICVGLFDPGGESIFKTAYKILNKYGLVFLVKSGLALIAARAWLILRGFGLNLKTYKSLQEVVSVHRIDHFTLRSMNSDASKEAIRNVQPDLIVVAAFSLIIKRDIIEIPPKGCINMHPSLLPRYRGPNPFYWVLQQKEKKTGITIYYIDEGIDTGDIILQREFPIEEHETERSLQEKSASMGADLLLEAIGLIEQGTVTRTEQNDAEASYYSLPPKGATFLKLTNLLWTKK